MPGTRRAQGGDGVAHPSPTSEAGHASRKAAGRQHCPSSECQHSPGPEPPAPTSSQVGAEGLSGELLLCHSPARAARSQDRASVSPSAYHLLALASAKREGGSVRAFSFLGLCALWVGSPRNLPWGWPWLVGGPGAREGALF